MCYTTNDSNNEYKQPNKTVVGFTIMFTVVEVKAISMYKNQPRTATNKRHKVHTDL